MRRFRQSFGDILFTGGNALFLIALCFLTLYPFWYVLMASFSWPGDLLKPGFLLWPKHFFYANYAMVWRVGGLPQAYLISILRVAIGVPSMLLVTGAIAFALSRKEMIGRRVIVFYLLPTMFFGGGLIPYYLLLLNLHLLNTFWVYVIPALFGLGTMIIMKTFFQQLPEGLVEAALLEGAGYLQIFTRIGIPLSKPVFATMALYGAVGHWNDWFTGAFFVSKQSLQPIQTYLQNVMNIGLGGQLDNMKNRLIDTFRGNVKLAEQVLQLTQVSVQMSAIILTVAPILILYPFLQKYFVKGALIGSLKG